MEIVSLNVAFWVRVLGDRGGEHAHRLCDPASYTSAGTYLEAIEPLAAVVDRYASGDGFVLALDRGPVVPGVDYHDTSVLVAYAQRDGELYTLVDEMVRDVALSAVPLVLLSVTSAYELLTALMTAVAIRRVRPSAHVCLVDHAWENFSLHRHIERFGDASPLLGVFDSVIAGRETQAADLRGLLDSLGFSAQTALAVTVRSVGRLPTAGVGGRSLAPPVVWTRVDDGTCYWGRCTFCVQNDKGGNERSAVSAAVTRARERVVELELRGVERVILADEALHPQVLSTVADGMADTSLVWCGRVKIDRGITGEVLDRVAASGGVELLVGLESASPRVQRLMDKYDAAETDSAAGFFASMSHSRVGLHLNLLAGFPSETVEEFRSTWTLARRVLAEAWLPTFSLNWFTLFNGSPAADRPAEFGLNQVEPIGDQLLRLRYRLSRRDRRAARAVQALLDECEADLWDAIGSRSSGDRVLDVATGLFAGSGYGLLLKANGIGASDIAAAATVSTG